MQQTKQPLPNESSAPIKTYEGHRFFVAFARDAPQVPSWDPDGISVGAQFVHRGFDQVVTAKVRPLDKRSVFASFYCGGRTTGTSFLPAYHHMSLAPQLSQINATTGELYLDDWDIHEGEMAKLARLIANCSSEDDEAYAQCVLEKGDAAVQR